MFFTVCYAPVTGALPRLNRVLQSKFLHESSCNICAMKILDA